MRLGLTIHEIYDGCGPPSDKATKGRRLLILSLSSPHSSKHGHLPLFCLHPLGFGWFADDPHACIFTTLYSLSSDGRPSRSIPFPSSSMHLIVSSSLVLHRIQSSRWRLQLVPCFYTLLVVDVYAASVVRIRRTSTPSSHTFSSSHSPNIAWYLISCCDVHPW